MIKNNLIKIKDLWEKISSKRNDLLEKIFQKEKKKEGEPKGGGTAD